MLLITGQEPLAPPSHTPTHDRKLPAASDRFSPTEIGLARAVVCLRAPASP
jgi:hypothetical protein